MIKSLIKKVVSKFSILFLLALLMLTPTCLGLTYYFYINGSSIQTHLSNFTDDLGNRGYSSVSNFTNNFGYFNSTANFSSTVANATYANLSAVCNYAYGVAYSNITGEPTALSSFTDDLGDRGYTHLSNFTDDLGYSNATNYTHLSNFTDDLGDRGYDSLSNFTDDLGNRGYSHLSNFTDDLGDRGYDSLSNFTNDFGYYNSTDNFTLSWWDVDGVATHLSNFTDDLGYTNYDSDEIYINEVGSNFTLNESKLNDTIDARDSDTTYSSLSEFINDFGYFNSTNNFSLTWWNITGVASHLSNFTDDLGDRGYDSLSNFTNDFGYFNSTDNFTITISSVPNANYSNFSNSSDFWDDLNVPTDLNDLLTLNCANITGATSDLCTLIDTDTNTEYTHLSNFTNDFSYFNSTANFSSTVANATYANNSANANYCYGVAYSNVTGTPTQISSFTNNFLYFNSTANFSSTVANATYANLSAEANHANGVGCDNITGASSNLCTIVDTDTNTEYENVSEFINDFGYYNSTDNFTITWTDVVGVATHLSNFTDDLGYVIYTHLSNFTNDLGLTHLSNFTNDLGLTHLSNFTDDLGNRGYSHLSNFTDDLGNRGYDSLSNFTDDLGDRGYDSLSNFTNDFSYFNSTDNFTISSVSNANFSNFSNSSSYWDNLNTPLDLNDSHTHACENITGATSDLCTLEDTDTQYTAGTNLTLTGTVFALNVTAITDWLDTVYQAIGNYILVSDEGDLNVNSSNYWDGLDVPTDLNDKLTLDCANITGATSDLCTLIDTDTNTEYENLSEFVNDFGYYNSTDNFTISSVPEANFSNFSNSSSFWDDLDVPTDLNDLLTLDWANITNKFITAVDNNYIYMSGTTAWFNDTKANSTYLRNNTVAQFTNITSVANITMTGNLTMATNQCIIGASGGKICFT